MGSRVDTGIHPVRPGAAGVVVAALTAVLALLGCGSGGGEGEDEIPDAVEDLVSVPCPVDWEKTPQADVAPPGLPVYYNRPYFTTCKEGAFYSSAWMSYSEPITEFDPETADNRVPCRSGQCRDGMCEDDLEFIEGKLEPGDELKPGLFGFWSADCEVCNPNNALYSVWQTEFRPHNVVCDGGAVCCEEPLPNEGPCSIEDPDWGLVVYTPDDKNTINMRAYGRTDCGNSGCGPELCVAARAGACVGGTSTLQEIAWDNYDCDSISSGWVVFEGEWHTMEKATIWMGNRKDFWDTIHGESTCLDHEPEPLLSMTYFTCSGAAIIQTTDDHWFRAVWLHRYDPSNCDARPCWMAPQEKLPVDFVLTELPGDPGLN